jgi:hypothetical protein
MSEPSDITRRRTGWRVREAEVEAKVGDKAFFFGSADTWYVVEFYDDTPDVEPEDVWRGVVSTPSKEYAIVIVGALNAVYTDRAWRAVRVDEHATAAYEVIV